MVVHLMKHSLVQNSPVCLYGFVYLLPVVIFPCYTHDLNKSSSVVQKVCVVAMEMRQYVLYSLLEESKNTPVDDPQEIHSPLHPTVRHVDIHPALFVLLSQKNTVEKGHSCFSCRNIFRIGKESWMLFN